jgi:hypothetical protein
LLVGGFSGVVLVLDGLATLLEELDVDWLGEALLGLVALPATPPVAEDWLALLPAAFASVLGEALTPDPTCAEPELHVSAMCFRLVTVKDFPAAEDDWVCPLALTEADDDVSLPVLAPINWTWWPTCCFRSLVAPFS